ncbi:MAG: PfkB family carbohydrate kinase [Candidatus Aenigmarchaeota archaeon]|nr:PfkB family carbohydrate kinase [Candidatus Aenigmarchaeota archaeon]
MKFLVIGNITKDIIRTRKEERYAFGGIASYGSITAAKLGCETHVLSRGNDELIEWIKNLKSHGINVELQESEDVTCFVNDYTEGERKQYVLSDAGKINHKHFGKVDVTLLGPVFNEITLECVKKARKDCKILSLDVQGFVRTTKKREVMKKFWNESEEFLKYIDLLKVGKDEISSVSKECDYEKVCEELRSLGVKVVELTLGENGSIIAGEEIHRIPAYKTILVDKTGSGDVFASAFAIRYSESKNALESGLFASAAASFVVEDFGTRNIAGRERVMERFKELAKRFGLKG